MASDLPRTPSRSSFNLPRSPFNPSRSGDHHSTTLYHESDEQGDDEDNAQGFETDDNVDADKLTGLAFSPHRSGGVNARKGRKNRPSDISLSNHSSPAISISRSVAGGSTTLTVDREGKQITSVGGLPLDLLQSLYLSTPQHAGDISSGPTTPTFSFDPSSLGRSHSRHSSGASFRSVSFSSKTTFPPVRRIAQKDRRRILVTGGAGFVGSHLVDRLMCSGHDVVVLDNFFSGSKTSISHWVGHPNFELVRADVTEPFMVEVDQIYHLACPASPKAYQANAVKTLKTNFLGTYNMLGLAKRVKARFLLSSTSEIYGSPEQHPQKESYWGHVNPVGPRACYDEGKRVAEALTYGYHRQDGVDVRVARIFNCYGPRMNSDDGRLVSNFVVAALKGEPLEIYGDGKATRSLMFIHDLVSGLIALMESNYVEPVNIGSEDEATVSDWAHIIRDTVVSMRQSGEIPSSISDGITPLESPSFRSSQEEVLGRKSITDGNETGEVEDLSSFRKAVEGAGKVSEIVYIDAVVDDPPRRRPDITKARDVLGWQPSWTTKAGIRECILYFANELEGNI